MLNRNHLTTCVLPRQVSEMSFNKLFRILAILFFFFYSNRASSLGVLTHEAIIDAAWEKSILPLLQNRYPTCTKEEINEAHAYTYGGAIAPDMGYYPFGNEYYTNLIHYIRSGDMVEALLNEAKTLNEFAFALGFLSHYSADFYGHPMATNISVPLVYPKMKSKFGDTVTYAQNNISHKRMEFGFDVLQTAKGNYAPERYHDFIGFKVDTAVLARAFKKTYGISIHTVFHNHLNLTVEFFRFMIANVFPLITRTAWAGKRSDIKKLNERATGRNFKFKMRVKDYNKEYGKGYKSPGFFPTVLSWFIKVIPKVGPLRAFKFKTPTAEAERYFDKSFESIVAGYQQKLLLLNKPGFALNDFNFDTGNPTVHCEYILADETYNEWLLELNKGHFVKADEPIKKNLGKFYKNFEIIPSHKVCRMCNKISGALSTLHAHEKMEVE